MIIFLFLVYFLVCQFLNYFLNLNIQFNDFFMLIYFFSLLILIFSGFLTYSTYKEIPRIKQTILIKNMINKTKHTTNSCEEG